MSLLWDVATCCRYLLAKLGFLQVSNMFTGTFPSEWNSDREWLTRIGRCRPRRWWHGHRLECRHGGGWTDVCEWWSYCRLLCILLGARQVWQLQLVGMLWWTTFRVLHHPSHQFGSLYRPLSRVCHGREQRGYVGTLLGPVATGHLRGCSTLVWSAVAGLWPGCWIRVGARHQELQADCHAPTAW